MLVSALIGCGDGAVPQVTTTTADTTTTGRATTTEAALMTLPPLTRGPGFGGFSNWGAALPGTYETTVFEPALRFSLEGSWNSTGESSNAIGLGSRTAREAGCQGRSEEGTVFCFDFVNFFGSELMEGFDMVGQVADHPEIVEAPTDDELAGHEAAVIELFVPYEPHPDGNRVVGVGLPDEMVERFPDVMLQAWGAIRFIQVREPSLLIQVTSPTAKGLELFEPRAQQMLDSVVFIEDR